MKNKILLTLLILTILVIPLISAIEECKESEGCIGSFPRIANVTIYQTCNNCTYCNFTRIRDDLDNVLIPIAEGVKNNTDFIYTINNKNFSDNEITKYKYNYNCGNGVEKKTGTLWFMITPTGTILGTGEAIIYVFLTLIFFGLIVLLFYFIVIMPQENETNSRGNVIRIIKMKYLRILFISILYPLIIILLNLMNGLATNFATLSMFAGILGFLFEVMLRGAWVFTVIMILWLIYIGIKDFNFNKVMRKLGRFELHEL